MLCLVLLGKAVWFYWACGKLGIPIADEQQPAWGRLLNDFDGLLFPSFLETL